MRKVQLLGACGRNEFAQMLLLIGCAAELRYSDNNQIYAALRHKRPGTAKLASCKTLGVPRSCARRNRSLYGLIIHTHSSSCDEAI